MKRKLVVRTLALLLTSVMVMETPMQSFAAENIAIAAEAAEETQDVTTEQIITGEESADENGTASDDGNTDGDSQDEVQQGDQDGAEEDGQGETSESGDGTGSFDTADNENQSATDANGDTLDVTADDQNTADKDKVTDSTDTDNDEGDNSGSETDAKTFEAQNPEEEPSVVAETPETITISATQFGTEPMNLEDFDPSNFESTKSSIIAAWKNNDGKELDISADITDKELEKLIAELLEEAYKSETPFLNVLPTVKYVAVNSRVQKVSFSYSDSTETLEKAVWNNGSVEVKYKNLRYGYTYKLLPIKLNSKKEYLWSDKVDAIPVTPDDSCVYQYKPEAGDYAYILYGYDKENKLVAYSNIVSCDYILPDVTGLKVSAVDRTGTTISWDKLDVADGYIVSRKNRDAVDSTYKELKTLNGSDTVSFKDETTTADGKYIYQVIAYRNRTDADPWKSQKPATVNGISGTVSLAKPSVSFLSPSSDQATVTWNAVTGAAGYEVYTYSNGSYNKAADVTVANYQLTGLQAGQVYQYAVCPYKTVEGFRVYGTMSDVVNVETKLGNSTIQAVAAAYNQINLTWVQTAQADGYEIYRNDQLYKTVNGISNCYLTDTVACGTTYNYKVRPFRKVNGKTVYGEFSVQVSAVTALPAAAMNKVTSVDYKTLDVSWKQGTGATGYELYRSTSSNSGFGLVKDITNGSTLTYRDTGLTIGTTYYYKVKAYRTENGKKVYALETGVISGTVNLGVVTGLQAKSTAYNRIEITWNKMSIATGYELYYSTSPDGNYKFLKKLGKNSVRFRWSKAQCGTTYYFQIRPIQKVKKVVNYGSFSDPASAMAVIGSPTDLKVSKVTYNTVNLKWKSVKGAKRYKVYYSDSQNGTYQLLTTVKGKSAKLTNLETGKTYYFKVAAIRDNFESTMTGAVSATPSMGNLSGLKAASVSSSELQISWKALKGLEKYVILRASSASGTYTQIGTTTKTSYTDTGLASGTTYYYKVYGMRGNYKTNECGPVNARTKDQGSINTSEDKKSIYKGIDVSSYQGDIDWDAVADDGVDFAMIRILTGKDASAINYDSKFKTNYRQARAAGLDVGVYRYSYARTRTQARKEAQAVIEALDGRKLDYPVVMDFEDKNVLANTSTNSYRAEIILAFKDEIEKAGYKFALYANKNWLENFIDTDMLGDTHIWIARWRSLESGHGYKGSGTVTMWQYTDEGSVKGISGNVDMDVSYKKYRQ